MHLTELIKTRRSIRKYAPGTISDGQLSGILECAMYAPTARNQQPWHFLVIMDRASLQKLSTVHPYGRMLANAALAILVCGDKSIEENPGYLIQDCSAATQNILLSAHAMGIGSVWLGLFPREERMDSMRSFFSLPSGIMPMTLVSLGMPAEKPPQPDRFRPERVHYDRW